MKRVCAVLLCVVAFARCPAVAGADQVRYDATVWFDTGEDDVDSDARISQEGDGTWSFQLAVSDISDGSYIYRLVVPTRLFQARPGARPIPSGWTPVNVCLFEVSEQRGRCTADGIDLGVLTDFLPYAVVEIWRTADDPPRHFPRKWATAAIVLSE